MGRGKARPRSRAQGAKRRASELASADSNSGGGEEGGSEPTAAAQAHGSRTRARAGARGRARSSRPRVALELSNEPPELCAIRCHRGTTVTYISERAFEAAPVCGKPKHVSDSRCELDMQAAATKWDGSWLHDMRHGRNSASLSAACSLQLYPSRAAANKAALQVLAQLAASPPYSSLFELSSDEDESDGGSQEEESPPPLSPGGTAKLEKQVKLCLDPYGLHEPTTHICSKLTVEVVSAKLNKEDGTGSE